MGGDVRKAFHGVPYEIAVRLVQMRREAEWFTPQEVKPRYIWGDILRRRYRTEFIADHLAGKR